MGIVHFFNDLGDVWTKILTRLLWNALSVEETN